MNLSRLISILHNQKNSYMNVQLKEFGLSHGQAITLKIIYEENNIKQEYLNKRLQIDKSAVTRLLQNMENKGLIKRIQSPVDKRFYLLEMTALGQEKQQIVDQTFAKKDFILVSGLSEKEQEELRRMLDVIQTNLKGGKINE